MALAFNAYCPTCNKTVTAMPLQSRDDLIAAGTRAKLANGKEGFTFDRNGPATCVLITVDNK
jgi:hypothetical protein